MTIEERRVLLADLDALIRRTPYEMVRGCFEGTIDDGYQGPADAFAVLAYEAHWQDAMMRLVALSAIAIQRVAQYEERAPLDVLADLWPNMDGG